MDSMQNIWHYEPFQFQNAPLTIDVYLPIAILTNICIVLLFQYLSCYVYALIKISDAYKRRQWSSYVVFAHLTKLVLGTLINLRI